MSITFGNTSAPSDITVYLDQTFSTSLSHWNKKLVDNIGATNAFLDTLLKSDFYESYDGGTDIRQPLMYELAELDWYDGYDELPLVPTDGITEAVFEARQAATPIQYSMKQVINNRQRIIDLVDAKIAQAEMGIAEGFARAFMWGAGTGAIKTPATGQSGAQAIEPLSSLIDYTPTVSRTIGNINQSTASWWRNYTKTSAATTYEGLLAEFVDMYVKTSRGTGGPPDLILVDETTYTLLAMALWNKYHLTSSDPNFNFTNIRLPFGNGKTLLVSDEKVPDVANNLTNTDTKGTAFFLNRQFARIRYIPERDFKMLTNESGKTFVKPPRGDSRLGHLAWMGAVTISNRRKFGVIGNIARTLT
jgi:hypothetical protein